LSEGESADYVDTGEWSAKAIKEAKRYGTPNVVASSKATNYDRLPKDITFSPNARYAHFTTNNTIEGTQWHALARHARWGAARRRHVE
jgi:phosphoserine aminotransferase